MLGQAGKGFDLISNFTETNGDVLNLTTALAATRWNGLSSTLGDYLKVTDSGGDTMLSVAPDGRGAGAPVAELSGAGSLGLSDLLGHHSLLT